MPTYEYECLSCGNKFERFHGMLDKPAKRCPKCRHGVRKILGVGAGIIFKGSGFYETDYKRKGAGTKETQAPSEAEKPSVTETVKAKDTKKEKPVFKEGDRNA